VRSGLTRGWLLEIVEAPGSGEPKRPRVYWADVYTYLHDHGPSTVDEISRALDWHPTTAHASLSTWAKPSHGGRLKRVAPSTYALAKPESLPSFERVRQFMAEHGRVDIDEVMTLTGKSRRDANSMMTKSVKIGRARRLEPAVYTLPLAEAAE
jgi:hypothetical protein